jgi:hypothetical protein
MEAKEPLGASEEPLGTAARGALDAGPRRERPFLMVDIDGVISLFGGWQAPAWDRAGGPGGGRPVDGSLHSIDGTPHFLSATAAAHLLDLAALFELVWASGWEERANEHLPRLLGLPPGLPFLRFERRMGNPPTRSNAHWKLDAIDAYAGERPLAWVDDALNDACHEWARARSQRAPTLLVETVPERGLTEREAERLAHWAHSLPRVSPGRTAGR